MNCPKCGANRDLLKEMLAEKPEGLLETENHTTARIIVGNCSECKKALMKEN